MTAQFSNIFGQVPTGLDEEQFIALAETRDFKLARIVSKGQATPDGEWYDQERAEWMVVLKGSAGLRFEDETHDRVLAKGDFVEIAPHRRHRVTWTDADGPTIWLALYFGVNGEG